MGLTALEHRPVNGGRSEKPMGWSTFDASVEVIDSLYKSEGVEKSDVDGAAGLSLKIILRFCDAVHSLRSPVAAITNCD